MKKISKIFIHHSASDFGDAKTIDRWHKERGWKGIGYHFVVLNGFRTGRQLDSGKPDLKEIGLIEKGRRLDADPWLEANEIGAHAYGYNSDSIAVCLIHNTFKYDQRHIMAYRHLVAGLCNHFSVSPTNVIGHYEVDKKKPLCPGLNMEEQRRDIQNILLWAKTFYMPTLEKYLDK